ncbi:MAG: hypothetical protein HQL48_11815 [Gammaproteobacteria bacterium]|nr:hypothetical protein [Gammaproteobacteria bacterium]
MGAECEERLITLIRKRIGIRILDHQLNNLRTTYADACQRFHFSDCNEYCEQLEQSSNDSQQQEHLVAGITVGESYFFRDSGQIALLSEEILPKLITSRRQQGHYSLRIWSAGCSDGQELYSIAILLDQLIPERERPQWKIHLLGTDINVEALSRAIGGHYREWSFRATSEQIREQYFTTELNPNGHRMWRLADTVRQKARFSYLNLYSDSFPSILSETSSMDLILCRNVFIYFDLPTVTEVMRKFYLSLNDGGILMMGPTDLVDRSAHRGFTILGDDEAHFLRKETADPPPQQRPPSRQQRPTTPLQTTTTAATPRSRMEDPQQKLQQRLPPALRPYSAIILLLGNEAWGDALKEVETHLHQGDNSVLVWQFLAKALANMGRTHDALEACSKSIQQDPSDKHVHFIQSLLLIEANRFQAAEDALRRTIFLDRHFVEAHYHLGLLLIRLGRNQAGIKSLNNALEIALSAAPDRRLHDAGAMNYGRLATILSHEIKMYQSFDRPLESTHRGRYS